MKKYFEHFNEIVIHILIIILLIATSPIILIVFIIKTIKDYFIYKKSLYYKDTREKYSWMCGESEYISFYDAIKNAGLPVAFYRFKPLRETGYGYFIYNDILILCDYDSDICFYDDEKDEWFVNDERDYVLLETAVNDEIKKVNRFLADDVCNRAIIFIENEKYAEISEKHYDNIQLLSIIDGDKISALKNIIV